LSRIKIRYAIINSEPKQFLNLVKIIRRIDIMSILGLQIKQLRIMVLACSLVLFGAFTPAWAVAPGMGNGQQDVSTSSMIAMGIGAIGGILAYSAITGDWGLGLGLWGAEAAATAAVPATTAVGTTVATAPGAVTAAAPTAAQVMVAAPNAAAEFVAAWGGRQVFVPASALVGALIGDWINSQ